MLLEILDQLRPLAGTIIVSIIGYVTVRYISNRDKFEEDIENKFIVHTDSFDKKLHHHVSIMNEHSKEVVKAVASIKDETGLIKQNNLDFQIRIQEDVHDIRKVTSDMGSDLRRTTEKLNTTFVEIGKIKETVNKHAKILKQCNIAKRKK